MILYAILTTFRTIGPYELNWDTQQYKCWISQYITFGLLVTLQTINLFWLYFILRIALDMVVKDKDKVTDVRSDDEADEEGEQLEMVEGGKEEVLPEGSGNGMNGHVVKQRRVEAPNGHALEGTVPNRASFEEVVEGKKEN